LLREGDKFYTIERTQATHYKPQKKFYANDQDFINTLPSTPRPQAKP
jgi:hypothetical protein